MIMPHRDMIELIADEGYMYVNRQIKILGAMLQIAKGEEDNWDLLPEEEALALERKWYPPLEDLAPAKEEGKL